MQIGEYLIEVSEHPEQLEEYYDNPKAALTKAGLTDEQQEIVLSDDPAKILTVLQDEYPELRFESEAWKPIRRPLPFPRPIRKP